MDPSPAQTLVLQHAAVCPFRNQERSQRGKLVEKDYRRFRRSGLPEAKWLDCRGVGCELEGRISVVGPGGVFIRTGAPYPVGRALGLRIVYREKVFELVAVVRSREIGGLGVEFMPMDEQLAARWNDLLAGLKFDRQKTPA